MTLTNHFLLSKFWQREKSALLAKTVKYDKKDEIQFLHEIHKIEKINDDYCRHKVRANTQTSEENIS